jgi:endonuclease/exonuclease/phosphatase (EEP) superfamily protein YafD
MKTLLLIFWACSSVAFAEVPEFEAQPLDSKVSVLVFNIQKMGNSGWRDDVFKNLVEQSDLVLVQESVDNFPDYSFEEGSYTDVFYKSWGNAEYDTGVSTLAKVPYFTSQKLVSQVTEPISNTPKVSSVETYKIIGMEQELMVINTHAINFVTVNAFQKQIKALYEAAVHHEGPMIWAGDFNTWNGTRKRYLDSVAKNLGLTEILFKERSEIFLELDHAYVRGGVVSNAHQLQLGISDHEPLVFEMSFGIKVN